MSLFHPTYLLVSIIVGLVWFCCVDMQQYNLRMQQQYGEIRAGFPRGVATGVMATRGYAPPGTYRQRLSQGQVVSFVVV